MQIIATHRERRRDNGELCIDAVLLLGEIEYVLERNCATRRIAQGIADEELRLIRRLVLARLRQLHTDRRPASTPLSPQQANEVSSATRETHVQLLGRFDAISGTKITDDKTSISPAPKGANSPRSNGHDPKPLRRQDTISTADL